ncbi:MAG: hypothetical protein AB7O80_17095 [Acetobacteraceae bacterium]
MTGILGVLTGYIGRPVVIWLHGTEAEMLGVLAAVHEDGITLQASRPAQTLLIPANAIRLAELHGPRVRA